MVLAVLFGLTGGGFAWLLGWAKEKCAALLANPYWRIGVGGVVVAALSLLCLAGRYSGLGTNLIGLAFSDGTVYGWDFLAKLLFTVVTLAVGFQGGEVTPLCSPSAPRWGRQPHRCWGSGAAGSGAGVCGGIRRRYQYPPGSHADRV